VALVEAKIRVMAMELEMGAAVVAIPQLQTTSGIVRQVIAVCLEDAESPGRETMPLAAVVVEQVEQEKSQTISGAIQIAAAEKESTF
jgi:hypothetical protein